MKKSEIIKIFRPKDILYDVISALFFSVGLTSFTAPAQIAPGGISGISIMSQYLFDTQLGTVTLLLNIPLLLLAWKFLGHTFTIKTMKTVLIQTLFLNYVAPMFPVYSGEQILAALFGGIFVGISLAFAFMQGTTTGGTDIASRLVQRRYRHVPIGRMLMIIDAIILSASIAVFGNIETALYGVISIYATAHVVDGVLYGLNRGKVLLVFTKKIDEITHEMMQKLDRGVTLLYAKGAYSGADRQIILLAVRASQYHPAEEIIKRHDPDAFVLTLEAGEIQGEGFKMLSEEKVT